MLQRGRSVQIKIRQSRYRAVMPRMYRGNGSAGLFSNFQADFETVRNSRDFYAVVPDGKSELEDSLRFFKELVLAEQSHPKNARVRNRHKGDRAVAQGKSLAYLNSRSSR